MNITQRITQKDKRLTFYLFDESSEKTFNFLLIFYQQNYNHINGCTALAFIALKTVACYKNLIKL